MTRLVTSVSEGDLSTCDEGCDLAIGAVNAAHAGAGYSRLWLSTEHVRRHLAKQRSAATDTENDVVVRWQFVWRSRRDQVPAGGAVLPIGPVPRGQCVIWDLHSEV